MDSLQSRNEDTNYTTPRCQVLSLSRPRSEMIPGSKMASKRSLTSSTPMPTFAFSELLAGLKLSECKVVADNAPGHAVPRQEEGRQEGANRFDSCLYAEQDIVPASPAQAASRKWSSGSFGLSPTSVQDDILSKKHFRVPEPRLASSMEARFKSNAPAGSRRNASKPIRQASIECLQPTVASNITLVEAGMASLRKNKKGSSSSRRPKKGKRLFISDRLPTIEL